MQTRKLLAEVLVEVFLSHVINRELTLSLGLASSYE